MCRKIICFVLAAGFGDRLRPITNHMPKPLLPVLGKPVIQYVLEKVSLLSPEKIGINLHYMGDAVKRWIGGSEYNGRVIFFPEDPALGTGGALKNAESLLSRGTFLAHNSDILSDMELSRLLEFHCSSGNLATLAVHDYPEFNKVAVDESGFIVGVGDKYASRPEPARKAAFTGIAAYEPEFLRFLPDGKSGVVDAWLKAVHAGYRIGTLDMSGCLWSDLGAPSSYFSALRDALAKEGETIYIHPSVRGCAGAGLDGYLAIEKDCVIDEGVSLKNCIALPGSRIESGGYENCIIGSGFKIELSGAGIGPPADGDAVLIGAGGSDRKYFRIKRGGSTAVLMQCLPSDADYVRHIEYTEFFRKYNVPVPDLLETAPDEKTAMFEDLGGMSLYNWLKCLRNKESVEGVYKKALDMLALLHSTVTGHVSECPLLEQKVFDYGYLRWETEYFTERFVKGVRGIEIKNRQGLNDEFRRLALRVDSFPKTVIHRDFQSQNIMITGSGIPRVIDYQGARMGPPAYDVASILWDPYHRLETGTRDMLLQHYAARMSAASSGNFDARHFMDTLLHCRLQRHMQALGAYGFLSMAKGKKYFLKYVREALDLLKEETTLAKDEYPALHELVTVLHD